MFHVFYAAYLFVIVQWFYKLSGLGAIVSISLGGCTKPGLHGIKEICILAKQLVDHKSRVQG